MFKVSSCVYVGCRVILSIWRFAEFVYDDVGLDGFGFEVHVVFEEGSEYARAGLMGRAGLLCVCVCGCD